MGPDEISTIQVIFSAISQKSAGSFEISANFQNVCSTLSSSLYFDRLLSIDFKAAAGI